MDQKDERGPGPVSPASALELTVKVTCTPLEAVNELSDVILVPVRDVPPPRQCTDLFLKDSKDRFELVHAREWHLVGRSEEHVVLRLMDRGEFVAQVSIAPWKKAEPGQHLSPEDVKSIVANSPAGPGEPYQGRRDQAAERPMVLPGGRRRRPRRRARGAILLPRRWSGR